jgi:hypothetical protein
MMRIMLRQKRKVRDYAEPIMADYAAPIMADYAAPIMADYAAPIMMRIVLRQL